MGICKGTGRPTPYQGSSCQGSERSTVQTHIIGPHWPTNYMCSSFRKYIKSPSVWNDLLTRLGGEPGWQYASPSHSPRPYFRCDGGRGGGGIPSPPASSGTATLRNNSLCRLLGGTRSCCLIAGLRPSPVNCVYIEATQAGC